MEQKNITEYEKEYEIKIHPSIRGIQIIEGKNNFPISWLNQQGYCEYQIYLQYMKGIETPATPEMTHGSEIHNRLEDIFKQDATPTSFESAVEASKSEALMSRECFVIAPEFGIRGYIDEIWMKPDEIDNRRQARQDTLLFHNESGKGILPCIQKHDRRGAQNKGGIEGARNIQPLLD